MTREYYVFVLPVFGRKVDELYIEKIRVICKKVPFSDRHPFTQYKKIKVNEEIYYRLKDEEFFYDKIDYKRIASDLQIEEFMI